MAQEKTTEEKMAEEELDEIYLLDGKVHLYQPVKGFKTSMDSVMLAAACPAQAGDKVLDMGSGVGGATFCLLYRVPDIRITGVEIQKIYYDISIKNKALNKNPERIELINRDVRGYEIKYQPDRFDHVICNPPYFKADAYTPSPDTALAHARGNYEAALRLEDWLDCGYRLLKPGGSFTIIHKAEKTDIIVSRMEGQYGDIDIIPLWPKPGRDAKRVIVRGLRNRKSPATLRSGIVMHNEDDSDTDAAERILRSGKAIL